MRRDEGKGFHQKKKFGGKKKVKKRDVDDEVMVEEDDDDEYVSVLGVYFTVSGFRTKTLESKLT